MSTKVRSENLYGWHLAGQKSLVTKFEFGFLCACSGYSRENKLVYCSCMNELLLLFRNILQTFHNLGNFCWNPPCLLALNKIQRFRFFSFSMTVHVYKWRCAESKDLLRRPIKLLVRSTIQFTTVLKWLFSSAFFNRSPESFVFSFSPKFHHHPYFYSQYQLDDICVRVDWVQVEVCCQTKESQISKAVDKWDKVAVTGKKQRKENQEITSSNPIRYAHVPFVAWQAKPLFLSFHGFPIS